MTNTLIRGFARDIAAMIPFRCPNFLATMHAAIDDYFDDRPTPLTADERLAICDAIIDLRF